MYELLQLDPGALVYESDGYVPTGERKQRVFGVGFRRKRGSLGMGSKKNWTFFGVNFPKKGVIRYNFGQI